MRRTAPLLKLAAVLVTAAALALAGVTAAQVAKHREEAQSTARSTEETKRRLNRVNETMTVDGVTYERRKGTETYLILGIDSGGVNDVEKFGGGQCDVLLLLVMDYASNTYHVLPINRDTITMITLIDSAGEGRITDSVFDPICLSHSYGTGGEDSCENTVRSVEYLLAGAHVDGYIAVNMDIIGVITEGVGGVTVKIDGDLTGADPSFQDGATVTLDAVTAERFVRARMSVGDEHTTQRMDRQITFLKAWSEKARRLGSRQMVDLLEGIESVAVTNMTEKRLTSVMDDVRKYDSGGFLTIDGEYDEERLVPGFQPDEDSIRDVLLTLYYAPVSNQA